MALVCDIKSDEAKVENEPTNEDLEDGEIEDDDDDDVPVEAAAPVIEPPPAPLQQLVTQAKSSPNEKFPPPSVEPKHDKFPPADKVKFDRRLKHDDKKKSHMTEAEKSVMYLHKLERMEREKREKYRREPVDDFASNIEKAIASVLKKDRPASDEEKDEEKRGKKRKKRERERKKKQRKLESPKSEEIDENEMLNVRGGSPEMAAPKEHGSPCTEESYTEESDCSTDRSGEDRRDRRREKREKRMRIKERNRERRRDNSREKRNPDMHIKDSLELCVYYIQGKCQKGDDCPYSHELQPPMKWELCKFYLNDCCAKGQPCLEAENCKFAHGKPLSERLKQILFKHIETAPKDILGRFPRMGRDEAVFKISQTQKSLELKYGVDKKEGNENINKSNIPSLFDINVPVPPELMNDDPKQEKSDKPARNRPSRWQDADPAEKVQALQEQRKMQMQMGFAMKSFGGGQDQDMRISSNGDVDMRTLGPLPLQPKIAPQPNVAPNKTQNVAPSQPFDQMGALTTQTGLSSPTSRSTLRGGTDRPVNIEQYKREAGFVADPPKLDVDIRSMRGDTDIRARPNLEPLAGRDLDIRKKDTDARQQLHLFDKKDVDIRQFGVAPPTADNDDENADEPTLQIVMDEEAAPERSEVPASLPKRQRELFMRIQAQQKENVVDNQREVSDAEENNVDWYSDDSNEGRLTIKDDDDFRDRDEGGKSQLMSPPAIRPSEMMEKLGDLSKIDISEEVTKLLSSMRHGAAASSGGAAESKPRDPRQARAGAEGGKPAGVDPRKTRTSVDEKHRHKISIYEQGSINPETVGKDVDLRSTDKDLDLRPKFGDLDLRSTTTSRPDVDLRQLVLPFKGMQNYTPATEIDASIKTHLPITWSVHVVDIPKPDYTGLKLSLQEAQTTGDPRLRKIFRLSVDEKDSPASPKESPKAVSTQPRVDPRRRKMEEAKSESASMSYAQQMTVLQGSSFYQNLTSNQKVMLNQELSTRDQTGGVNEQILAGILGALGLVQGQSGPSNINGSVLNLLSSLSSMINPAMMGQGGGLVPPVQNAGANPAILGLGQNAGMVSQNPNVIGQQVNPNILTQNPNILNHVAQSIGQPGLLGVAPGIPNLPPDFQINFNPRNGGLLGNAPPFVNFPPENQNFNNFNDDFYPEGGNFNGGNRDNRTFNRDRPQRRGRNFNRNNRNNNFRNRNRSNRSHTPP